MSKNRNLADSAETSVFGLDTADGTAEVFEENSAAETAADGTAVSVDNSAADGAAVNPPVLVYIGPTIFRTALISGRVFITHGAPIDEILTDELRQYPLARKMFVPPEQAALAIRKIHDTGTSLGDAYRRLSGGN